MGTLQYCVKSAKAFPLSTVKNIKGMLCNGEFILPGFAGSAVSSLQIRVNDYAALRTMGEAAPSSRAASSHNLVRFISFLLFHVISSMKYPSWLAALSSRNAVPRLRPYAGIAFSPMPR